MRTKICTEYSFEQKQISLREIFLCSPFCSPQSIILPPERTSSLQFLSATRRYQRSLEVGINFAPRVAQTPSSIGILAAKRMARFGKSFWQRAARKAILMQQSIQYLKRLLQALAMRLAKLQ